MRHIVWFIFFPVMLQGYTNFSSAAIIYLVNDGLMEFLLRKMKLMPYTYTENQVYLLLNLVWLCGLPYLLSFGRSANIMIFAHHYLMYDPWIVSSIVRPTFLMGSQVRLLALYLASRNNFILLDYMMFFSHRYKDLNMICVFSHQLCRSNPHSFHCLPCKYPEYIFVSELNIIHLLGICYTYKNSYAYNIQASRPRKY